MIALREVEVLGLFVTPALPYVLVALALSMPLRRLLDWAGIDRFVWNRALFDLCLIVCVADLLILSLRF